MLKNNPLIKMWEPFFANPIIDSTMCWWFDRTFENFLLAYYWPMFVAGDMEEVNSWFRPMCKR
jgi:hypothetical protein